jgi:F0F1-type ATP synthase epsilon subunit
VRSFAAPAEAAGSSSQLTLNFSTPHTPIHVKKTVSQVILPGGNGEYGVTAGHSPIISELKPGIVTVIHTGGETEKFFVPGGFALTHPTSVTVRSPVLMRFCLFLPFSSFVSCFLS